MDIALVLAILVGAVVLFATERLPADQVALLALGVLLVFGLVTPAEAVSGLSNPATVTVAAMFVLSAGLQRTGAVTALGAMLIQWGRNRTLLLLLIMGGIGVVSAFINNTAAVAIFLPLVLSTAAARRVSSSRLLIPLSYASQFGGVCTLIGTSTNILVSAIAESSGVGGFSMFEFLSLGAILFAVGTAYLLVVGRWLLPDRRTAQLTEDYRLGEYISELRVTERSPFIGQSVLEHRLGEWHDVTVLEVIRGKNNLLEPLREPLQAGDILLVRGKVSNLMALRAKAGLEIEPEFKLKDETLETGDLELVEALVAPHSGLIGQSLKEQDFRWRYKAVVLAIQRRGQALREQLATVRLHFGDALLLLGRKDEIARLRQDDNLIVLEERRNVPLHAHRAPLALAIIAAVVLLAAMNVMPILVTAILGFAVMTLTGCLRLEDAYRAIDWKVIVMLASVLPLGIALEKTGAVQLIADTTIRLAHSAGPGGVLAAIYLLTAVLTECMSNNAAAVILAPIAITTAAKLGVSPKPFLMAVTFAASTSFATPVGYQTNTMVYNAGGYRFSDFLKVGIPLNLLFWGVSVYFIPKLWPF